MLLTKLFCYDIIIVENFISRSTEFIICAPFFVMKGVKNERDNTRNGKNTS